MSYLQNIIIPKIFEAHTANVADVSDLFVTNFWFLRDATNISMFMMFSTKCFGKTKQVPPHQFDT